MGVTAARASAAAWAFGLLWIAGVDPVPGWVGTTALASGAAAGALGGERGWLLAAAGAAPLAHAACLAGDPIGPAALGLALALSLDRGRGVLAGGIAGLAAALAARQAALGGLLAGAEQVASGLVGLGLAAIVALGAPRDARSAGLGLAIVGSIAAGRGLWFERTVGFGSAAESAAAVASRRAVGAWPRVEAGALQELADGSEAGVRAVIAHAPTRMAAGEALARSAGVGAALDAGWAPGGAVAPDLAPRLAWALVDRGRYGEARAAVTRINTPETAFHRAAIADLQGDLSGYSRAWSQARRPPDVPGAPGPIWQTGERTGNFLDHAVIGIDRPVTSITLQGEGTPCAGDPTLEVRVGVRPVMALPIREAGVTLPFALAAGAYRLEVGWANDLVSGGCDRNIGSARLTLE